MKRLILILLILNLINTAFGQILDNSSFRIYRAPFINSAVTHLRFDSNGNYELSISEINCSLCDRQELADMINSKGTWQQNGNTIILKSDKNKLIWLFVESDSLLKPYFPIGFDLSEKDDSTIAKIIDNTQNNGFQDFHLIYDTYPNGVARFIIDRYRARMGEYEIEIKPDGTISKIDYYWNGKKSNRIR
jgi:hypothetical protein